MLLGLLLATKQGILASIDLTSSIESHSICRLSLIDSIIFVPSHRSQLFALLRSRSHCSIFICSILSTSIGFNLSILFNRFDRFKSINSIKNLFIDSVVLVNFFLVASVAVASVASVANSCRNIFSHPPCRLCFVFSILVSID